MECSGVEQAGEEWSAWWRREEVAHPALPSLPAGQARHQVEEGEHGEKEQGVTQGLGRGEEVEGGGL